MVQAEKKHETTSEAPARLVLRDDETGILMPLRLDFVCLNDFAFNPEVDFDEIQGALVGAGAEIDRLHHNAKEAAAELTRLADKLKQCSTTDGEWDGTEEKAREEYQRLMALAAKLIE